MRFFFQRISYFNFFKGLNIFKLRMIESYSNVLKKLQITEKMPRKFLRCQKSAISIAIRN